MALAQLLSWKDEHIADNTKKAIFLELRQKQLATGHIMRRYPDFHFFDPKKLV